MALDDSMSPAEKVSLSMIKVIFGYAKLSYGISTITVFIEGIVSLLVFGVSSPTDKLLRSGMHFLQRF